ncbi:MAG: hypothetical protein AAFX90_07510 [Pseudomonadota bacterium]
MLRELKLATCLSLSLATTAASEVKFYGIAKVVGWDEEYDSPISGGRTEVWNWDYMLYRFSNLQNLDDVDPSNGRPKLEEFARFDALAYESAIEEGYRDRLPSTPEQFHELQMRKRCDIWAQNGSAPEGHCNE